MSGTPTEAEVQTQWKNSVAILEATRNYADATVLGTGKLFDTLEQSLEGEFTPTAIANAVAAYRSGLSTLVDPSRAAGFLAPLLYEYAKLITTTGNAYRNLNDLMRALYEHFKKNTLSVKSRAITYDTSATLSIIATNVGNGTVSRLTVDENDYNIENCTVEKKLFRCRQDQNSGVLQGAEVFECAGTQASQDSLLRGSFGSGIVTRLRATHAGSGSGGSLLSNSSFQTYSATATPRFSGWTLTAGAAADATQDTTTYYRLYPGTTVGNSLKITTTGATVTLKQAITSMRISQLDPNTPYFLRVMVNKGTASTGNFVLRLGASSVSTAVSTLAAGWNEIKIPLTSACWPRVFTYNDTPFDIEIEWSGTPTAAQVIYVDDAIFVPWDLIDGTYWNIRGANLTADAPWKIDDTLEFTDTGGAPGTGKIQYWLWVAGLGYLRSKSDGTETFADPV